jgi:hypothetical protein
MVCKSCPRGSVSRNHARSHIRSHADRVRMIRKEI